MPMHIIMDFFLWDKGKQNSPRCDTAEGCVPSGAILFAYMNLFKKKMKYIINMYYFWCPLKVKWKWTYTFDKDGNVIWSLFGLTIVIWAASWKKLLFAYSKTKTHISFAVTAKLISAFVFAIRIVQSISYLHPKFQTSSHLLLLYSPVCVGPGRKPRRPVFSQRGSFSNCRSLMDRSQLGQMVENVRSLISAFQADTGLLCKYTRSLSTTELTKSSC